MNLNKVMLIGRLTRNPEKKTIPSGHSVCSLGLATNRVWKDQAGQRQEKTEFHNIVLWRRLAEIATEYLVKGSLVYIEGRLETHNWEKDGIKQYRTEIIADVLQMGPRVVGINNNFSQSQQSSKSASSSIKKETPPIEEGINPKDIPF